MKTVKNSELMSLCDRVEEQLSHNAYTACIQDICYAKYEHPDAPEPHNLMGILLERQNDHSGAMRNFRATLDLDPTYLPARENMMNYASLAVSAPQCTVCYADCAGEK